jgi:ribosomal-protein-alanine N-acetyltransferase
VKGPPSDAGEVEIGYGLAGPSRGRGLGGRTVAALVEELRLHHGVRRIVAYVVADNLASRRALERNGFALVEVGPVEMRYTLVV